jgi:hypothetical protein
VTDGTGHVLSREIIRRLRAIVDPLAFEATMQRWATIAVEMRSHAEPAPQETIEPKLLKLLERRTQSRAPTRADRSAALVLSGKAPPKKSRMGGRPVKEAETYCAMLLAEIFSEFTGETPQPRAQRSRFQEFAAESFAAVGMTLSAHTMRTAIGLWSKSRGPLRRHLWPTHDSFRRGRTNRDAQSQI